MNRGYGHYGALIGRSPAGPATPPVYRTPGGAMNSPAEQTSIIIGGSLAVGILLSGIVLALSAKKKR